MKNITFKTLAVFALAHSLTSCSNDELVGTKPSALQSGHSGGAAGEVSLANGWTTISSSMDVAAEEVSDHLDLRAVLGDREIPYPVYPNGHHYRIGDENGLKIIVFQTKDTFEEVDAYYQSKAGLPRLSAMKDYVRYSTTEDDRDPWETNNPGIVIHEFSDTSERLAVGADDNSRTNIIMSFR